MSGRVTGKFAVALGGGLIGEGLSNGVTCPVLRAREGGAAVPFTTAALIASCEWRPMQPLTCCSFKLKRNRMTRTVPGRHTVRQVRCNLVFPSLIESLHAAALRTTEEQRKQSRVKHSARCLTAQQGTPWNAALFLAIDESNYLTGLGFAIDGGLSL